MEAYQSCDGRGYARLDIRMDEATGKFYMLEVNAQCGLSEDENYTSIGAILKVSDKTFTEIIFEILKDALRRDKGKAGVVKKVRSTKIKKTIPAK
jgi:D-alanine-D-alanine ligase